MFTHHARRRRTDVILQLNPQERIAGTKYGWQVERLRIAKGKSKWEAYLYFKSLSSALAELGRREIRTKPIEGLASALEAVDTVCLRFDRLVDGAIDEAAKRAERKLRAVS